MNQAKKLPPYELVQQALIDLKSSSNAAEAHGILCGVIAAGNRMDGKSWLENIVGVRDFKDEHSQRNRAVILELYQLSFETLQSVDFDFELLLPDDEKSLKYRAEALTYWCQGFVTGLNLAGINIKKGVSQDSKEALHNLAEISKLDFETIEVSEEDEKSFFEVSEYVRMAAILLHSDILESQLSHPSGQGH